MQWTRWHILFFLGFIVALSFLTYFWRYWEPPAVFWDENYHIASAQKYLHGVFFMEQHPPLGKLLIALGEKIFHPNAQSDQFLGTDYGTNFPAHFSFVGYRFFSALLSWWTAPLLFLIFFLISRNPLTAAVLSFLYVFDNALIVHSRGAMLEGPLDFFAALTMLSFFLALEWRNKPRLFYAATAGFGVAFALVMTTKVLGLIFILLVPALLWKLWPRWKQILHFGWIFSFAFLLVYCSVWEIHFALGSKINASLPDNGYYQASPEYKKFLAEGKNGSLFAFPTELRDSLKYVIFYNDGAPRLDLCKEDENGSPFFFWPLGARSINYRWETPDSKAYRYLYLVVNPAVWWSALLALFLACAFLSSSWLLPLKEKLRRPYLLCVFVGLYLCYMIAISRIGRVLYLYHYFLPLLMSFVVVALVWEEIQSFGRWKIAENGRMVAIMIFGALIFLSHQFYRPLTYYEPISDAQFELRALLPLWELHCVNCQNVSPLTVPFRPPPGNGQ